VIQSLKSKILALSPRWLTSAYYRSRQAQINMAVSARRSFQAFRNRNRSAQEVFSEVYSKNQWGGASGEWYSGAGSRHLPADLYVKTINEFISSHRISSIVDLGCGDFEIGKQIALQGISYTGVDIVPDLIERNNRFFANALTRFRCLDIAQEPLPEGDLCLIRQVLQHLSNRQISSVLAKARKFSYLIITEHYPNRPRSYNRDKIHGSSSRVEVGSAVYLDKAPFNARKLELLLETRQMDANKDGELEVLENWGRIRTYRVIL
jgi:SAM-dependent methyltransferase